MEGDRPPARRRRPALVLVLLGAAALGAFFYLRTVQVAETPIGGSGMSDRELQDTYAQLCRTRSLAETRVAAARDLFFGRVHSPLHLIARAAEDTDRGAAARLLEVKNDVEAAFRDGVPGPGTTGALDRLLTSTAEALRSVGVTTSGCETP